MHAPPVSTSEGVSASSPPEHDPPTHEPRKQFQGPPATDHFPQQELQLHLSSLAQILMCWWTMGNQPVPPKLLKRLNLLVLGNVSSADASQGVGNNAPAPVGSNQVQETVPRSANSTTWFYVFVYFPGIVRLLCNVNGLAGCTGTWLLA